MGGDWTPENIISLIVAMGGFLAVVTTLLSAVLGYLTFKVKQIETNTNSLVAKMEVKVKAEGKAEEKVEQAARDEQFAAGQAAGPQGASGAPGGPMVAKTVEIEAESVAVTKK